MIASLNTHKNMSKNNVLTARKITQGLVFFSLSCLATKATAQWQSEIFESGGITHFIAASNNNTAQQSTLEIFCTQSDHQASLSLYIPNQRFGRRQNDKLTIQIDKSPPITLPSSRHAMAITSSTIPNTLLQQLNSGNRATVYYTDSRDKKTKASFSLRGSSKAIKKTMKKCRLKS